MTNYTDEKEILSAICDYQGIELTYSESKEYLDEIATKMGADFWIEVEGNDIRVIHTNAIDEIWTEELIDTIKETQPGLDDLPWWVAIDWEETASNCKQDGMGHHFSSYDGSEHESKNYHYFLN